MNIEKPLPNDIAKKVMVKKPTAGDLENWFTYHSPTDDDIPKYKAIREKGLAFARQIYVLCPPGPDTTAAIRKVREAVMTANAAIACCGEK
ncbi:hypothetical protein KAR91_38915 [Candidatus Pacearchaeota archaeon]|nr:hypothetical protein [Candidatus Pacearchaeota archaeon]